MIVNTNIVANIRASNGIAAWRFSDKCLQDKGDATLTYNYIYVPTDYRHGVANVGAFTMQAGSCSGVLNTTVAFQQAQSIFGNQMTAATWSEMGILEGGFLTEFCFPRFV